MKSHYFWPINGQICDGAQAIWPSGASARYPAGQLRGGEETQAETQGITGSRNMQKYAQHT